MNDKLTQKQETFCLVYIQCGNASEAYRTSYDAKDMSVESVSQAVNDLLKNPKILLRVEDLREEKRMAALLTVDLIIAELLRVARVDIRQAFDENGKLKAIKDLPEDVARAVSGIDVFEEHAGKGADRKLIGFTKKLKLTDKTRALELLGKYLKMFTERMELEGGSGIPLIPPTLNIVPVRAVKPDETPNADGN